MTDDRPPGRHGVPLGRPAVYPFHRLEKVGDNFVAVGGNMYRVRSAGAAHLTRTRDVERKFQYLQVRSGIMVLLVSAGDPEPRTPVQCDRTEPFGGVGRDTDLTDEETYVEF